MMDRANIQSKDVVISPSDFSRIDRQEFSPFEGGQGDGSEHKQFPFWGIELLIQRWQYIFVPLLLLAITFSMSYAQQAQTPFQQLTQRFENGAVFEADFTHHYEDSYTGNTSEKSGKLWIGKEKYKIESSTQLVAVDGKISRVYDSKRNRLIVSEYVPEEDDFAPSRILNGVDSTYTVEKQEKTNNGFLIELSSDDPFSLFQSVKITLDNQGIPKEIFVKDTAENLITTSFSGGSFIERSSGMFELDYPQGAEIIDMRNNGQ